MKSLRADGMLGLGIQSGLFFSNIFEKMKRMGTLENTTALLDLKEARSNFESKIVLGNFTEVRGSKSQNFTWVSLQSKDSWTILFHSVSAIGSQNLFHPLPSMSNCDHIALIHSGSRYITLPQAIIEEYISAESHPE